MFSKSKFINPFVLFIPSLKKLMLYPFSSTTTTTLAYHNSETGIFLKRQKRKPDRFGINKCLSIEKLIDLFQNPKFSLTLNEHILIFSQITHLAPSLKLLKSIYNLTEIMPKIQVQISDVDLIDEDPLIGSLMLSMKIMNCYKVIDYWVHYLDLIMADCFDPEADEILKAIQGIDGLDIFMLEDWQKNLLNSAFLKIEMLLLENLKIMKYNMQNLKNICDILIKNERTNPEVFEEIDFQITKCINGERENYDLQDMISFSYFFSMAEYHSINLFTFTNNMLLNEIILNQKKNNEIFQLEGLHIGYLMHFWNFHKSKEAHFQLDETIQKWVYSNSIINDVIYNIEDLISIHNGLYLLEIHEEKMTNFRKHLENKLLKIDTSNVSKLNLNQIEKYFRLRAESEFKNDYNQLPLEVYRFFDILCSQTYERFHHNSVYAFFSMLEKKHILNRFPDFFSILPKFIECHTFQYEFDDVCFFYLMFISNSGLLNEEKSGEFYSSLNHIKEFIKFVALRRGFKMDMDSNFHKLLSAIDLALFFEGGEG